MSKVNEIKQPKGLEIIFSDDESTVFTKSVSKKGRTIKDIKAIEKNLATTTIHYFNEEDFNKLKKIEVELRSQLELTIEKRISLLNRIYKFLEIK